MQGTGLVALCACASVLQPAAASVAGGASSIIVDIAKEAASADHATAMHGASARRADEPLAAWLARLDDWQPVAGGASEVPASGTVDVVCNAGAETFRLRFRDPRAVSFQGKHGTLSSAQRLVVLPSAFLGDKAEAACDVRTAFYHEMDVFARAGQGFTVLADTLADAEPRTEKRVGPSSEVHNLVFLAAGYTAAERTKWEADLAKAVEFFVLPPGEKYVKYMPLYRYFDAVNIFSVWQPSPESGATIPPGPKVNNNLGCTYGSAGIDRLLDCDEKKVLALAETTDAKPQSQNTRSVVALVLVNSDKYGGSGGYSTTFKQGTFYASSDNSPFERETFAATMFHELGHAWVDLADEYVYDDEKGPTDGQLTNCAGPDFLTNNKLPWQHLIDAGLVPAKPSLGCSWVNWYRAAPTCLMQSLDEKELCPVCREKMTLSLYDTPTFSTTWPSCPLPSEVVHVAIGGSVRLHANSKLVLKDNFDIAWELVPAGGGAPVALCQQCGADLEVSASALQAGLNTVRLTVSDTTPWVFTKPAAMTQSRTFALKVVDSVDTANLRSRRCYCADESGVDCRGGASFFSNAGASDVAYYSECDTASGKCELHTTAYEKALSGWVKPPRTFPTVCGTSQEVLPASGTLAHPASGSEYKNNENLCWMLQCDGTATLDWRAFKTEDEIDFVEVYAQGADGRYNRVFHKSGAGAPNKVQHDGNVVVRFYSDEADVRSGFRAAYACGSVPAFTFTFPTDCGDKYALSGAKGTVEHPAGSDEYGEDESKCWHVPCAGTLQLTWTQFETEASYDHVTLYKETGLQVWKKSGTAVPAASAISGGAMLRFKSDYSVNAPGFTVSWTCAQ